MKKPARRSEAELDEAMGLPVAEFLYTLDQIAFILGLSTITQLKEHVYFRGVTKSQKGRRSDDIHSGYRMVAFNLKPTRYHKTAEWRVPKSELMKYLRARGITLYERKLDTVPERKAQKPPLNS